MKRSRSTRLLQNWAVLGPRARSLEGRRGAEHRGIVEPTADDLQPDRQTVLRESARHRRRRLPRHVERIRERDPRVGFDRLARDLGRIVESHRERRTRDLVRQQKMVTPEEITPMRPPGQAVETRRKETPGRLEDLSIASA